MANNVFANGREVSCKAGAGKVIAAFPDVVFTPPQTPATPLGVPIPYPVTSISSDTTNGSKTVKINNKAVMLRNQSYFKKCSGDEAGTAPKKGFINSSRGGKTYFKSWSMDVKIEGENVVRHLDLTTSNDQSELANASAPTPEVENMAKPTFNDCSKYVEHEQEKCKDSTQRTKTITIKSGPRKGQPSVVDDGRDCTDECKEAKACILKPKDDDKTFCCHPLTTGHHLVEVHGFCERGDRGTPLPQFPNYREEKALCVCADGDRFGQVHGKLHAVQGIKENFAILDAPKRNPPRDPNFAWTYGEARQAGLEAHAEAFKNNKLKCNPACLAAQLDTYHNKHLTNGDDTPLRTEQNKFGRKRGDQRQQGVTLIRERAERVIGEIIGAPFPLK
jgi:hypothetical protein